MIVFDLKCGAGHVFEAWFGSNADFGGQRERGLVSCPICGDAGVEKAVMAPNVAAKGNSKADVPMTSARAKQLMAELASAQAKVLENSEWVGRNFAQRARAMHDGEQPQAVIHGEATAHEARSLLEDGIAVAPLPLPVVPPEKQN